MLQVLAIFLLAPFEIFATVLTLPEVILRGDAGLILSTLSENLEIFKEAFIVLLTPSLW